jgi:predicted amidohydrolase
VTEAAKLRVACLQLSPTDDLDANLAAALMLAADAARDGARFILLPEYALLLHASGRVMRETKTRIRASRPSARSPATPAARCCWAR